MQTEGRPEHLCLSGAVCCFAYTHYKVSGVKWRAIQDTVLKFRKATLPLKNKTFLVYFTVYYCPNEVHMFHSKNRIRLLALVIVLLVTQLACKAAQPNQLLNEQDLPAATESPVEHTTLSDVTPTPFPEKPTQIPEEPLATSEPPANEPGSVGDLACFSSISGIACLGTEGWEIFTSDNSSLPIGSFDDIEACPGGRVAAVHSTGVAMYDGEQWTNYEGESGMLIGASAVACDETGFWLAYMQGVMHYDGNGYIDYPAAQIDADASMFDDIALAPDGAVWVISNNTVSKFDGQAWTTYKEGQGFNETFFFQSILVDASGIPWVSHSSGLLHLEGDVWKENSNNKLVGVNGIALDAEKRVWISTYNGLFTFEKGGWTQSDLQDKAGVSNHTNSVAIDSQGRIWTTTDYGIAIFDGSAWSTYFMHTADLPDNEIKSVSISGAGPTLPVPLEKASGSLSAQLLDANGQPLAGAQVEICVQRMGDQYYGDTPCDGQPFVAKGETDAEGRFTIENLPTGYYIVTYFHNSEWAQLVGQYGSFSERVLVEPDKNTDIGEIKLQQP